MIAAVQHFNFAEVAGLVFAAFALLVWALIMLNTPKV